jgi:hypothetical protein
VNPAKRTALATALAIGLAGPAEGLRRTAYYDPPGILTVCKGHTGDDVVKGKVYSLAECDQFMTDDMRKAINIVERCVPGLEQGQFHRRAPAGRWPHRGGLPPAPALEQGPHRRRAGGAWRAHHPHLEARSAVPHRRTSSMSLQPHEQRVVDEKADLDTKLAKLATFLEGPVFFKLPEVDRQLLELQKCQMQAYSLTLALRIGRF